MEQTGTKYNKNWSLTTEQINRFKGLTSETYTDIFEVLSEFLGGVCDYKNCPVECDLPFMSDDCQKRIAEYIKSGTAKNKVNKE